MGKDNSKMPRQTDAGGDIVRPFMVRIFWLVGKVRIFSCPAVRVELAQGS